MIYKINWTILLLIFFKSTYCQAIEDTSLLSNEINRVMSFAINPYEYCLMETKMSAMPVLEPADTMNYKSEFYKNETDFYYNAGPEVFYLQDSFFIQINQQRRSIWISKVDIDSKEKINFLPVGDKQLQKLLQKEYTIKKTSLNKDITRLNFATRQQSTNASSIATNVLLEYSTKDYLPTVMEIKINMQQLLNNDFSPAILNGNLSGNETVQTIEGKKYIIREQALRIAFLEINNTKEKAVKIPRWKDILDYDATTNEFSAKGLYKEYEVTKTF